MSFTMQRKSSPILAQRVRAATAVRGLQQRLTVTFGNLRRSGYERILAGSVDHFEVERRERAWNRCCSQDGSLLGR